jgi:hypothetical protein
MSVGCAYSIYQMNIKTNDVKKGKNFLEEIYTNESSVLRPF